MHGQPRLHAIIPQHVRQLLAELELISHGSTQSWNSAGGHGESTAELPFGELHPPHVTLRVLYLKQETDAGRASVTGKIRDELEAIRGHVDRSHVVGETREQEDKRIIQQGEGFTPEEVALRFNCTPSRVRRARLAASRGALDGKAPLPADDADHCTEALRMKSSGMSERQIAMALGQHRTTVTRWLKKAA